MAKRFGLSKAGKLKSRKQIDRLFAEGRAVTVFPVRAIYRFEPATESTMQAGVSVSKRHFKKAVDRNRIKRLLREAYRLQKEELVLKLEAAQKSGRLFLLYTDKNPPDFATVMDAVAGCLKRLGKQIDREKLA